MISEHLDDDRVLVYALGDLEASERQTMDMHLRACPACSARVEELERLLALTRTRRERPAPVRVLVELLARQRAARRRVGTRRLLAPLAAAAALGGLLFGAGYVHGLRTSLRGSGSEARRAAEPRAPLPPPPPLALETAVVAADNGMLGPVPRPAALKDSTVHRKGS